MDELTAKRYIAKGYMDAPMSSAEHAFHVVFGILGFVIPVAAAFELGHVYDNAMHVIKEGFILLLFKLHFYEECCGKNHFAFIEISHDCSDQSSRQ